MSDLTDRITAVLREVIRTELGLRAGEYFPSAVFDKAAERVAEALQLTEEHGYRIDGENPGEPDAWFPAADYKTSRPVSHRRWVSGWSAVEEKP